MGQELPEIPTPKEFREWLDFLRQSSKSSFSFPGFSSTKSRKLADLESAIVCYLAEPGNQGLAANALYQLQEYQKAGDRKPAWYRKTPLSTKLTTTGFGRMLLGKGGAFDRHLNEVHIKASQAVADTLDESSSAIQYLQSESSLEQTRGYISQLTVVFTQKAQDEVKEKVKEVAEDIVEEALKLSGIKKISTLDKIIDNAWASLVAKSGLEQMGEQAKNLAKQKLRQLLGEQIYNNCIKLIPLIDVVAEGAECAKKTIATVVETHTYYKFRGQKKLLADESDLQAAVNGLETVLQEYIAAHVAGAAASGAAAAAGAAAPGAGAAAQIIKQVCEVVAAICWFLREYQTMKHANDMLAKLRANPGCMTIADIASENPLLGAHFLSLYNQKDWFGKELYDPRNNFFLVRQDYFHISVGTVKERARKVMSDSSLEFDSSGIDLKQDLERRLAEKLSKFMAAVDEKLREWDTFKQQLISRRRSESVAKWGKAIDQQANYTWDQERNWWKEILTEVAKDPTTTEMKMHAAISMCGESIMLAELELKKTISVIRSLEELIRCIGGSLRQYEAERQRKIFTRQSKRSKEGIEFLRDEIEKVKNRDDYENLQALIKYLLHQTTFEPAAYKGRVTPLKKGSRFYNVLGEFYFSFQKSLERIQAEGDFLDAPPAT